MRRVPTVLPPPALLSATERRRTGRVVRLALAIAVGGGRARGRRGRTASQRIHILHRETGKIATSSASRSRRLHRRSRPPALPIPCTMPRPATGASRRARCSPRPCCARSTRSFCAGLLEALVQVAVDEEPILLVAYDADYPPPMQREAPRAGCVRSGAGADAAARARLAGASRGDALQWAARATRGAARGACAARTPLRGRCRCSSTSPSAGAARTVLEYLDGLSFAVDDRAVRLNRGWIESHIPHQGRMCLLDEVLDWHADRIRCASGGHRAADHPLRAHGRLGIACGIEIAAQTMAVHGALSAAGTTSPRVGSSPVCAACACTRHGSMMSANGSHLRGYANRGRRGHGAL